MKRREKRCRPAPMWMMVSILLFLTSTAFGQSGTAVINLNQTHITFTSGQAGYISYTVTLQNGSAGLTSISVSNQNNFSQTGIKINFSNSSGVPPFGGLATISATKPQVVGTFTAVLIAIGANQSSTPTVLQISITPQLLSTTTVAGQITVISNSTTTGKSQSNNSLLYSVALVIIIIIVIVLVAIRFVGRRPKIPQPFNITAAPKVPPG